MSRSQARVTVFAMAGALAGVVPVPILPRRILRAIRGAMAHDLCAAHGLALTTEAREILAEPTPGGTRPTFTKDALAYVAARAIARFGPYATIIAPVRTAFDTLAFGRLLDRYLEKFRPASHRGRVVRIDGEEALTIRRLLDNATARAIRPGLNAHAELPSGPPEDYRNPVEKAIDTAMITAARLPEWLATRLDVALDDVMAGHRDGEAA
ncbi:MAG: hypothetical protein ACXVEF_14620 [Polyangiales bacterium]